jgi:hypothetical protein
MNLRLRHLCYAAVIMAVLGSPAMNAEQPLGYRNDYFSLELLEGFNVTKTSPVEDFDVYWVAKDSKRYIGVYVGNHPSFPKLKNDGSSTETTLKTDKFEMRSLWKQERLTGRELLVRRLTGDGWPSHIHAWSADIPGELMPLADKILSSLSMIPQKQP